MGGGGRGGEGVSVGVVVGGQGAVVVAARACRLPPCHRTPPPPRPTSSTPQNKPPHILANASTWAAHMGVSSNLRYQAINGLDALLQPLLPRPLFGAWTVAVRSANNVLGGVSFVVLAKLLGVQASAGDGAKKAAKGAGAGGPMAKPA